ncbi:SRPBCC family protein [Amycolatopsis silviterrae]|uniref:SRPBCC family protein n=1 Tax=Amycolatopsis silviterrae TaxID=1656914 RepID=A0ABW5HH76_9PSEU
MEFSNDFTVPTDVATAWTVLTDVPRIAPCLPGATVEPADGDTYHGSVSMKVGPIKVSYRGTAAFQNLDEPARRMVLDARGTEKTGKGSAAAVVTVTLHEESSDKTRVDVHTELQITGKLAQFGRNAMADVGARLIGQFATNLETLLAPAAPATPTNTPTATRPAPDLDALTFLTPLLKRAAPTAVAFVLGVLLTWLAARRGTARAEGQPAAQP